MPSLLTLPLELLVAISTHLSTEEFGFLRLTCKRVEKSLYSWFADEFFTKKQFMLTYKSLKTLVDISKHETFSKHLTHVILATNTYALDPYTFRTPDQAARWIQGFYDQQSLMSTGHDQDMLTEAFERLVNLQVVGIRDFNANNRRRDGNNATWSSWGAPTVLRETGVELPFTFANNGVSNMTRSFLIHIFQTLIYALARASRKPREIEVLLRKVPLPDMAFHFPDFLTPSITPILQNLETLLVSADRQPVAINDVDRDGPFLRHFLGRTDNIRHLRINFQKYSGSTTEEFLEWLGQPDVGAEAAPLRVLDHPPIELPRLKQLELGQMRVKPAVILKIIDKFAFTLKEFCLWRVNLLSHPNNVTSDLSVTADFLKSLADNRRLRLTKLKLGFLQQDGVFTSFKTKDLKDGPCDTTREYTGENMGPFIRELIDDIVIQQPVYSSDDSSDDSNEDDNDDLGMIDDEE